jgi:hypothetical protein
MATRRVLEQWGVLPLVSPPYLPRFNGAVEAGAGHCKTRTHIIAARMLRPGRWTADDVEGARIQANRTLRPWGIDGPTPEERWKNRKNITTGERDRLRRGYMDKMAEYSRNPPPRTDWAGAVFQVARKEDAVEPSKNGAEMPVRTARQDSPARPANNLALPRWARIWNSTPSPGHRRPRERPAPARLSPGQAVTPGQAADETARPADGNEAGKIDGASEKKPCLQPYNAAYCHAIRRRSLTDVLVDSGLLVIRRRRIPLPIKRLMRLKI